MLADDIVVCFPFHLVEMLIPPLVAAFITAELFLLAFRLLNDCRSAVLTRSIYWQYLSLLHGGLLRRFLQFLLPLLLSFKLCRMKFRESVFLNVVIKQMHFCCAVIINNYSIDDKGNIIFIRLQFLDIPQSEIT